MQNHLLFLHDLRVPATNNEAERLLRNYKRKQAQARDIQKFREHRLPLPMHEQAGESVRKNSSRKTLH